ncbi:MAG: hypothetical protein K9M07_06135 [Simkaniaceae bacterium]|nr:hypothetical protein [Simkaniaceae bacterium]MCF7852801.1 hypothetical protein [Simkaniaceae bacterium]
MASGLVLRGDQAQFLAPLFPTLVVEEFPYSIVPKEIRERPGTLAFAGVVIAQLANVYQKQIGMQAANMGFAAGGICILAGYLFHEAPLSIKLPPTPKGDFLIHLIHSEGEKINLDPRIADIDFLISYPHPLIYGQWFKDGEPQGLFVHIKLITLGEGDLDKRIFNLFLFQVTREGDFALIAPASSAKKFEVLTNVRKVFSQARILRGEMKQEHVDGMSTYLGVPPIFDRLKEKGGEVGCVPFERGDSFLVGEEEFAHLVRVMNKTHELAVLASSPE